MSAKALRTAKKLLKMKFHPSMLTWHLSEFVLTSDKRRGKGFTFGDLREMAEFLVSEPAGKKRVGE